MRKYFLSFFAFICALAASQAWSQLPANPWKPNPNDGYFGDNASRPMGETPDAPVYEGNSTKGEIQAVDPWARARDRSGVKTWRGSAQHGKLNYIGEATTYGTAMGQEMIAPEVNRHNMIVMLDHFRSLGYKIPDSYNQGIMDMPKNYKAKLRTAYDDLGTTNVIDKTFLKFMEEAENASGLDFENILFNTMDLLGTD